MRVIGMISGTSFDAVEALLAEIETQGESIVCDLIEHTSVAYPPLVHDDISAMLPPSHTTIEQVCRLDVAIGQFFGEVARGLVDKHGMVDAVCSHGQTVYHWVEGDQAKGTLQLGEPAWIAERTGVTVVSDVRSRDIAAGGHGAPLASLLDVLLLGSRSEMVRGSLNLGGIANVTVVRPDHEPIAFDIGPSNALMDVAVARLTDGREHFDRDGTLAARGQADELLTARLLDDPYFSLDPPKSTGKEYFNWEYVTARLGGRELTPEDLLASLTAASAESIAAALRRLEVADLVVAGGGTRNRTLMSELQKRLPGLNMRSIAEFGIPEAAKEALVFALIGFLTLNGLPATVPSCTGARRASLLGSITPGSQQPLPRPFAAQDVPVRLVVRTPLSSR